jgi:hypothetical protein
MQFNVGAFEVFSLASSAATADEASALVDKPRLRLQMAVLKTHFGHQKLKEGHR